MWVWVRFHFTEGRNPRHKFLLNAGVASEVEDGRSQGLGGMGR